MTILQIQTDSNFDRQLHRLLKKNYSKELYVQAILAIAYQKQDELFKLKDHALVGNRKGHRELHVDKNDWLLIYRIDEENSILYLIATGTHQNLFGR